MKTPVAAWNYMLGMGVCLFALFAVGPLRADPPVPDGSPAVTTLRQAFETLHQAKAMSARLTVIRKPNGAAVEPTQRYRVAALQSNYLRVEPADTGTIAYVADGTSYTVYNAAAKTFRTEPLLPNAHAFSGIWEGEIDAFFGGWRPQDKLVAEAAGTTRVDGVLCDLVRATRAGDARTVLYAIGRSDHLIRQSAFAVSTATGQVAQTNTLTDIRLDPPLAASQFALHLPEGARAEFAYAAIDAKAKRLLEEVVVAECAAQTLTARAVYTTETRSEDGTRTVRASEGEVRLKKPNKAYVMRRDGDRATVELASDGKAVLRLRAGNQYGKQVAHPLGWDLGNVANVPLHMFFDPQHIAFAKASETTARYAGQQSVDGTSYDVVVLEASTPFPSTITLYVDPQRLITRAETRLALSDHTTTTSCTLKDVHVGQAMAEADFEFVPPPGAKVVVSPSGSPAPGKAVAVGQPAPPFTLPMPQGGVVSLAEARLGKKATLINFWFLGCAPCRIELPTLQKLYAQLRDKGLSVVSVNDGDPVEAVGKYVAQQRLLFPIGINRVRTALDVFTAYGVTACPTNYILDSAGRVAWVGSGFDEGAVRAALKRLGVE